ncbi:uncharacterized protein LOC120275727 [Dioscorea cayenensis subsp. rotundata]|uniref:Uncharacterized protein LOC120275727 n=1 Tax=Dioscorea cayennensis subsp. rotundata TaxID=55577 RepID=A0AB40CJF0_DIOCR|nr:uncharacterized protein LOC120275727 [Dioscorea cayenensis subsp. rotundata]
MPSRCPSETPTPPPPFQTSSPLRRFQRIQGLAPPPLPLRVRPPLSRPLRLPLLYCRPLQPPLPPIPFLIAVLAFSHLLFALLKLSFNHSSSKQYEKQLSLLSRFIDCKTRAGDDHRRTFCADFLPCLEILTGILVGDKAAPVDILRRFLPAPI